MEAERAARSRAMELSWRKKESPASKSMPRSVWIEFVRVRVWVGLGLGFRVGKGKGKGRGGRVWEKERGVIARAGERKREERESRFESECEKGKWYKGFFWEFLM